MSADDPNRIRDGLKRAADDAAPRAIDVDAVLRASRARRRSRRTAVVGAGGAAAALLAVGGLVMGLQGTGLLTTTSGSAPESASIAESPMQAREESADGFASDASLAPPEKMNPCGAPVAEATDATGGSLSVAVESVGAVPTGGVGAARVTVTNSGPAAVEGELRVAPAMTIAAAGVTVWHSNGSVSPETTPVVLAPGESIQLEGLVEAVSCTETDEAAEAFPPGLPPLTPGSYGVTAVVVFVADGADAVEYLVAPLAPLTVE
ncbi:hypothetical protein J7E25_04365 [Agromyces sp. ISL-38]|uniref:hypothetical protein n=1 Tax=Agromyces sp. ISL-38 TaxID=2819107 RepID=UPI001BE8A2EA|nr:hypothetical protein [Agromyces sp. ISL-38]MBT2498321.1 hypothetical protein [Agromyces sp. ISL-38]